MTSLLIILALFGVLLAGMPVAFTLGGLGLGLLIIGGFSPLMVPQALLSTVDNFVLVAVPLFILMSTVLLKGGVGKDLFAAVQAWVGHLPGGLAIATILSCGLFAAISGSSVATAATIGTVAIPEMTSRGYPRRFVLGLLAAGGTLGILIPPSIPMIVYAFIVEESPLHLFFGGVGPGVLLIVLFIAYSVIFSLTSADYMAMPKASWATRRETAIRAFPTMVLAVVVVAGIYLGMFTPTEAAAVGFVGGLVITGGILRSLTWQGLKEAVLQAMVTSVSLLLIVAGAKVFGKAITLYRIPQDISALLTSTFDSPLAFVVAVSVVLLVMGLVLESLSMLLIMVPVLAGALAPLGIDPVWFGVFFVIMIECALITPPVGMNLYVIQAVGKAGLGEISLGVWPFLVLMLATVALCYLWPGLILWLPFHL